MSPEKSCVWPSPATVVMMPVLASTRRMRGPSPMYAFAAPVDSYASGPTEACLNCGHVVEETVATGYRGDDALCHGGATRQQRKRGNNQRRGFHPSFLKAAALSSTGRSGRNRRYQDRSCE